MRVLVLELLAFAIPSLFYSGLIKRPTGGCMSLLSKLASAVVRSLSTVPHARYYKYIFFCTQNCRIERSRSILPDITRAIEGANGRFLNTEYFYELLFTTRNLKLVHPACHDKTSHEKAGTKNLQRNSSNWYRVDAMSCGDNARNAGEAWHLCERHMLCLRFGQSVLVCYLVVRLFFTISLHSF